MVTLAANIAAFLFLSWVGWVLLVNVVIWFADLTRGEDQ